MATMHTIVAAAAIVIVALAICFFVLFARLGRGWNDRA
jgi:hypothetical protein